jgi:hypothetical protein
VLLRNPVSVQAMRDGIVDKGVYGRYANEIILLADWASQNQSDWFTPFGLEKYGVLKVPLEDETKTVHRKRMKSGWIALLKNSNNVALFDFNQINAQRFIWSTSHRKQTKRPESLYPRLDIVRSEVHSSTWFEFIMAWDQMLFLKRN